MAKNDMARTFESKDRAYEVLIEYCVININNDKQREREPAVRDDPGRIRLMHGPI